MTAAAASTALPAFRHEAPNVGDRVLPRERLQEVLKGRFARRLTVVTAGAGFGKTTLLAQVVVANQAEPIGDDVWLRLEPADRDPDHLLGGLARSLLGPTDERGITSVNDLVELVWTRAPTPVCLVLDDTHQLDQPEGGGSAWATVRSLLDHLPTNGSILLAGRTPPDVPVSRLRASDAAVVLDEEAMAFTEAERRELGEMHGLPDEVVDELPPWPAVAALTASVGRGEPTTGYLWREVLSAIDPLRLELLARAALFEVVDDLIVGALAPASSWTAARLVDGLPLVDTDRLGTYRMHALWSDALDDLLTEGARQQALEAGAEALLAERQFRRAAAAYARAGDVAGLQHAIRTFATQPIASVTIPDVAALYELLPDEMRSAPIGRYLDAARHWSGDQRDAAARFEETMQCAIEFDDREIESLARWRLVQLRYLDDHDLLTIDDRMEQLAADGVPLASSSVAWVRSVRPQNAGRADDAIAEIDLLDGFDPGQRLAAMKSRLVDLGRPEAISTTLETVLGPDGLDLFGAQALWLRGEVDPETAWSISSQLPGVAGRRGVLNEQVTLRCIIASIAMAAGALDSARELVDQTRQSFELGGKQLRLVTLTAEALVALHTDGEDAARSRFEAALATVPLGRWPSRAYLYALAAIRALVPGSETLDECELGPSLLTGVRAGAAIAALRANAPAAALVDALPWDAPDLLRAQVPSPLLTELALARSLSGGPAGERARDLLERLPHRRRWLGRIARSAQCELAEAAEALLAQLPDRPSYDLRIDALGPLRVERTDDVAVHPEWDSRERVRQLLVRLILHRTVGRTDVAAELWPDLPTAKAAANLRVNLRHLQQALQPDRPADSPPWFVRSDGALLRLADDGVHIDVDRFDALVAAALRAEANGMPSVALAEYHSAIDLYRGDLLEGIDDPVVELERLRLRSIAHGITCRRGELVLAHGEPETAMRLATDAQRLDPLSERAHRLFIRSQLALGSTSAARSAATRLLAALARDGLEPDEETKLLLRRLDL